MVIVPVGCRTTQTTPRDQATAALSIPPSGEYAALSNDQTYWVQFTPSPDPIPLNQMFALRAWVCSAEDRTHPLTDVTLRADAAMPEHDHGMNTKPKVRADLDGSFAVGGMLFHMPGHWELYLDVTRAGVTERAQFPIELE